MNTAPPHLCPIRDSISPAPVGAGREKTPTALFFKYNSQLGPPYQVLVDTNFINFSIKNKVRRPREALCSAILHPLIRHQYCFSGTVPACMGMSAQGMHINTLTAGVRDC